MELLSQQSLNGDDHPAMMILTMCVPNVCAKDDVKQAEGPKAGPAPRLLVIDNSHDRPLNDLFICQSLADTSWATVYPST